RAARAAEAPRPEAGSSGGTEPTQRVARDLAVVERDGAVGELLALLMALARAGDRLPPVGLDLRVAGPGEDLGDDRIGVLAARIVGGDNRDVCQVAGD